MRFVFEGVCVGRYCRLIHYGLHFPVNQVGGHIKLCIYKGLYIYRGMSYNGFDCTSDSLCQVSLTSVILSPQAALDLPKKD